MASSDADAIRSIMSALAAIGRADLGDTVDLRVELSSREIISLLIAVEQLLGVRVDFDSLMPDDFVSVVALSAAVQRTKKAQQR